MNIKEMKNIQVGDLILISALPAKDLNCDERSSERRSRGKGLRVVENQALSKTEEYEYSLKNPSTLKTQVLGDDGWWYFPELIEKIITIEDDPEYFL